MGIVEEDVNSLVRSLDEKGVSFRGKSVLVTGGAGFLGSWICDVLVKQGARVICVDNFSSGQRANIGHLVGSSNFRLVEHDISQRIIFDEKIDVVMHLASRASPFEFGRFPIQILKANTLGTWIVLGIAKKHKARLVYASTSEIYGDPDPAYIPTPETYNGNVNPVGSRSCYDEAKRAGEAFVTAYRTQHGLDDRIARIFNTYGPRMRPGDLYGRVIPRFIDQAVNGQPLTVFGDGTQTRSFCYATDTVMSLLLLATSDRTEGEVVNVGNTQEISILELAKRIREITACESDLTFHPLPEDDPKRRCPDTSKLEELTGWKPEVSFEEGLEKTISWFSSSRIEKTHI